MKILLLGANGQVGRELQRSVSILGELIACDRKAADLEHPDNIRQLIIDQQPEIIINAAAYTAVDRAESDEPLARLINATAVKTIAETAAELGALLVHYSTDYIFDGRSRTPYTEDDTPAPLSVYGKTKLEGEQAIHNSHCRHLIFRTSWVYATQGNNFIKTILRLAREKHELRIINDQHGSPTSASLIADITCHCIKALIDQPDNTDLQGTYHLTARGTTNWYAYAQHLLEIAESSGLELSCHKENILSTTSEEYAAAATRPEHSLLDCSKLESTFGLSLPKWQHHVNLTLYELFILQQ